MRCLSSRVSTAPSFSSNWLLGASGPPTGITGRITLTYHFTHLLRFLQSQPPPSLRKVLLLLLFFLILHFSDSTVLVESL